MLYLTFKNKYLNKETYEVVDEWAFLNSRGVEGKEIKQALSTNEWITVKKETLPKESTEAYIKYMQPIYTRIADYIDSFLRRYPNFVQEKDIEGKFYKEFKIPKKKLDEHGNVKYRHLINPINELKVTQKYLQILTENASVHAHNAAHGFVKGRDFYTNAEKHKNNNHIINLDLKNFFDTITTEVLTTQLKKIPFFYNMPEDLFNKYILIATYKNRTPQGTPLSPMLSNLIMTPFDYELRQKLNNLEIKTVYTRYADDTTFSSKKSQDIKLIIHLVEEVLQEHYNGLLHINYDKTKKLTPGLCFITGVKLNMEHNLTVGSEKKRSLKAKIHYQAKMIRANSTMASLEDSYKIIGYLAFMNRVEPNYTNYLKTLYIDDVTTIKNHLKQNGITEIEELIL